MSTSLTRKVNRFNVKDIATKAVLFIIITPLCFSLVAGLCLNCNQALEPAAGGAEYCRKCNQYQEAGNEIVELITKASVGLLPSPPRANSQQLTKDLTTLMQLWKDQSRAQLYHESTPNKDAIPYEPFTEASIAIPLFRRIHPHIELHYARVTTAYVTALALSLTARSWEEIDYSQVTQYIIQTLLEMGDDNANKQLLPRYRNLLTNLPKCFMPLPDDDNYFAALNGRKEWPKKSKKFKTAIENSLSMSGYFLFYIEDEPDDVVTVVRSRQQNGSFVDYYILLSPALIIPVASETERPTLTSLLEIMRTDQQADTATLRRCLLNPQLINTMSNNLQSSFNQIPSDLLTLMQRISRNSDTSIPPKLADTIIRYFISHGIELSQNLQENITMQLTTVGILTQETLTTLLSAMYDNEEIRTQNSGEIIAGLQDLHLDSTSAPREQQPEPPQAEAPSPVMNLIVLFSTLFILQDASATSP